MIALVAVMALVTLLALAWLARPWWSRSAADAPRRRGANVDAYRARLAEIDADVGAGLITDADAATLKAESGARLLDDAGERETAGRPRATPRWGGALLVLVLAGFAGAGYYANGSWRTQRFVAGEAAPPQMTQAEVETMIARLAERLRNEPDNVDGWAMLGRAYFATQRYAEAARAYAEVNRITDGHDADALTAEGESLGLARDRELSGRPRELFEKALAIEPQHGKGLWYAGLAAAQGGDPQTAQRHWTALLQQPLPDDLRPMIERSLAEIGGTPPAAPAVAAAPAAGSAPATAGVSRLQISLRLAPELRNQIGAGATLLVFARAASGPPMPLAVYRVPVPAFPAEAPLEVVLDDSMAMMPTLKISQFDRWTVTARISASGQAQAQSGDLEGSRGVAAVEAAAPVALTIDRVVP